MRAVTLSILASLLIAAGMNRPLSACTVFAASQDGLVLFSSNEDWKDPYNRIWFFPPDEGKHGRIYFGPERYGCPEIAFNDQGLAFDGLAVPSEPLKNAADKPTYYGNLVEKVMEECATVAEVLEVFGRYNLSRYHKAQLFFVDRTGDAAIIEGDYIRRKKGPCLIATNFRLSKTFPGVYPCERYRIAAGMLKEAEGLAVDLCRRILANVHMEGETPTQYSTLADLTHGVIYLYHFHNFENVVALDVKAELAKGYRAVELASLFPKTYAAGTYTTSFKEPVSSALRKTIDSHGVEAAAKKYRFLKKNEEFRYDFSQNVIDVMGHELSCQGRHDEAIAWMQFMVDEYPDSSFAHWCLGEAHRHAGHTEQALAGYDRALELEPDSLGAAEMARRLRQQTTGK